MSGYDFSAWHPQNAETIKQYIEDADGNAVAGAIFAVADAINYATYRLGTAGASTPMGGLEIVSLGLKEAGSAIAEGLRGVSQSIDYHKDGE